MSLFKKFFGSENKEKQVFVEETLETLLEKGGFGVSYEIKKEENEDCEVFKIEFSGEDTEVFISKEGGLLDSFQVFIRRALQHKFTNNTTEIICDCDNFREKTNQSLLELAEHLKNKAIKQGRSIYVRPLSPKDRKVVHQFLSNDDRVKTRSVGEGLYKKIKIYPNNH